MEKKIAMIMKQVEKLTNTVQYLAAKTEGVMITNEILFDIILNRMPETKSTANNVLTHVFGECEVNENTKGFLEFPQKVLKDLQRLGPLSPEDRRKQFRLLEKKTS